MAKKSIIFIGALVCFYIIFFERGEFGGADDSEIVKSVEVLETAKKAISESIIKQDSISQNEMVKLQEHSKKLMKTGDEISSEIGIKVYDSFIQIEMKDIHQMIEFPSIDILGDDDVTNLINEQIYNEIIPKDFGQYEYGREEVEIYYEIEIIGKEIISIHFQGYQAHGGSYAEYNKGLNFDLRSGKVISLEDYYALSDVKSIIVNARDENEIHIVDFPVSEVEIERQIDNFVSLFDTEEYISHTDIFFFKDNHIYFIMPLIESMRQSIYMEINLDEFDEFQ